MPLTQNLSVVFSNVAESVVVPRVNTTGAGHGKGGWRDGGTFMMTEAFSTSFLLFAPLPVLFVTVIFALL
jgi:hypothetical protein